MGDDVTNIIIEEPTTEEDTTYEAIGEELLARLDETSRQLGELYDKLADAFIRIGELEAREFSTVEHTHEGLAAAEHTHEHEHDGYALIEHEHQAPPSKEREPDRPPEKQHPYFRKIGEL